IHRAAPYIEIRHRRRIGNLGKREFELCAKKQVQHLSRRIRLADTLEHRYWIAHVVKQAMKYHDVERTEVIPQGGVFNIALAHADIGMTLQVIQQKARALDMIFAPFDS